MKRKRDKIDTFDDRFIRWDKAQDKATGKWADKLWDFRDAAESLTSNFIYPNCPGNKWGRWESAYLLGNFPPMPTFDKN